MKLIKSWKSSELPDEIFRALLISKIDDSDNMLYTIGYYCKEYEGDPESHCMDDYLKCKEVDNWFIKNGAFENEVILIRF